MTQRQRILVCGATGFIGRNIVERLSHQANAEVIAVEHETPRFDCPDVAWVRADLTCQEDVQTVLQGIDIVVQAAATTSGAADIVQRPYIHTSDNAVMNSYFSDGLRPEHQTCRFFQLHRHVSEQRPTAIRGRFHRGDSPAILRRRLDEDLFRENGGVLRRPRTHEVHSTASFQYIRAPRQVRSGTVSYVRRDRHEGYDSFRRQDCRLGRRHGGTRFTLYRRSRSLRRTLDPPPVETFRPL